MRPISNETQHNHNGKLTKAVSSKELFIAAKKLLQDIIMDPVRCCFWMQSNASRFTFFVPLLQHFQYLFLGNKNGAYDINTQDINIKNSELYFYHHQIQFHKDSGNIISINIYCDPTTSIECNDIWSVNQRFNWSSMASRSNQLREEFVIPSVKQEMIYP